MLMIIHSLTRCALKALTCALVFSAAAFAGDTTHRFVVFGDSLSDPGNYYFIYRQSSEPPFAPIPSAPYDERGHHFTDGRTWIERLALDFDNPESGRPAFARPGIDTNYAVGRARARPGAPEFAYYDLGTQVATFLADYNGEAPGKSTYVIWIGANDIDDALTAAQTDESQSAAIIQAALSAVATNIETLYAAGARSFFVPNLPDFGLTPAVQSLGEPAIAAATQLSTVYNGYLAQTLSELQALPGIKFTTLDVFSVLHEVVANPSEYGITDAQTPCLQFYVTVDAICAHPDKHLFWDAIHPTVAGHAALEDAAEQALHPRLTVK
jgi:phospholipase/lecithinase/hemolysin